MSNQLIDSRKTFLLQSAGILEFEICSYFQLSLGIKEHLLFLHARTGCDITSNIFNKGKASLVLRKMARLRQISTTRSNIWSTYKEVDETSFEAFKIHMLWW